MLQRALILQTGQVIDPDDLVLEEDQLGQRIVEIPALQGPENDAAAVSVDSLDDGLRCAEEQIIIQTLREQNGSRKSTAEKLGISPRTLRYKLAKIKASGAVVPC